MKKPRQWVSPGPPPKRPVAGMASKQEGFDAGREAIAIVDNVLRNGSIAGQDAIASLTAAYEAGAREMRERAAAKAEVKLLGALKTTSDRVVAAIRNLPIVSVITGTEPLG